ncbi:hypothetical protein EYR02_00230 [Xanthomonas oryzae pv. oryzae]|uniref:hypothetical protein n=1 Tax=Xanthomonas oryzae TaxID=347 RepID=UPI0010365FC8|nr:hypothetical protein [Xanthomonas oryzae]QBI10879.1 hypothetical protein EYR02_00230 [Xanthomonas oryzae pv. oryzae]
MSKATRDDGSDATPELLSFAAAIGLESVVTGRYSFLLLLQLFGAAKSGMLNPAKVVSQIRVLEGVAAANGLKAATQFKPPPRFKVFGINTTSKTGCQAWLSILKRAYTDLASLFSRRKLQMPKLLARKGMSLRPTYQRLHMM